MSTTTVAVYSAETARSARGTRDAGVDAGGPCLAAGVAGGPCLAAGVAGGPFSAAGAAGGPVAETSASAADAPIGTQNAHTLATIRIIDDFYRRVDELYRQTAARMGLADCDFDILYALAGEDGLTQKQLGERGFSSKQTVHSAVKRMVAKGFVTMRGDSPRFMRAYLTKRGRAFCENNIRAVLEGECRAVETFSPAEQQMFVSALARYADALDTNLSAIAFR